MSPTRRSAPCAATLWIALLLPLGAPSFATAQPTAAPCAPFDGVSRLWRPDDNLVTGSALSDLDGDGDLDLVLTTLFEPELWILPGDGHGRFAAAPTSTFDLGGTAGQIEVADIDGDTFDDLIVLVVGDNPGLRIFTGDGSAGFNPVPTIVAVDDPLEFALGDVDGNGTVDVVTLTGYVELTFGTVDTQLSTRLGDGNGNFSAPDAIVDPSLPGAIIDFLLDDVNGDGAADLFAFEGTVAIGQPAGSAYALADGLGGFAPAVPLGVGGSTTSGLADLNADGFLDLIIDGDDLSVFLGDGGGGYFLIDSEPGVPSYPNRTLQVADFDGDGNLDLVVSRLGGYVDSWVGDGTGALTFQSRSIAGTDWYRSAVGDLDGDSQLDLVLPSLSGIATLYGDGTGHFGRGQWFDPGGYWGRSPLVADWNADGVADVGVISPNLAQFIVGVADGGGSFTTTTFPIDPVAVDSLCADFNGDGNEDVAVGSIATDTTRLYLGDGLGGFAESGSVASPQCVQILSGDFDGDTWIDLVSVEAQSNRVYFSSGDGSGGLAAGVVHERAVARGEVVVGDFDEDGLPDLLTVGTVWSLATSNGDGTFDNVAVTGSALGPVSEAIVADFNQDGHLDVAASRAQLGDVQFHFGDGAGAFPNSTSYFVPGYPDALAAADFDNNGALDLLVANGNGYFEVLLANGLGGFHRYARLVGYTGGFATVGDFDGDGTSDLLGPGTFLPNVCVEAEFRRGELNEDGAITIADGVALLGWLFGPPSSGSLAPRCADAADTNDDGAIDLSDPIALLAALFIPGAPPIPPPSATCGVDPTADPLLPCAAPDCP